MKIPTAQSKFARGFSLIEMLVAVAVFAIIAIVTTQSLASSFRNSRKSDAIRKTRENVDFALSTMERLLRNAQDVDCQSPTRLNYEDEYGNNTYFNCAGGYIASGSARLTSDSVIVDCSQPIFVCSNAASGVPEAVQITLSAEDALIGSTEEGARVVSRSKVLLRNYVIY